VSDFQQPEKGAVIVSRSISSSARVTAASARRGCRLRLGPARGHVDARVGVFRLGRGGILHDVAGDRLCGIVGAESGCEVHQRFAVQNDEIERHADQGRDNDGKGFHALLSTVRGNGPWRVPTFPDVLVSGYTLNGSVQIKGYSRRIQE
jgi:hypothetical protein